VKKLIRRVGEGGQHTGGDAEWKKVVSRKMGVMIEGGDWRKGADVGYGSRLANRW
jgi:hypothetical protein